MKLLMVVNEDRFFLSHRKPVALSARDKGYDVVIVTKNTGHREEIEELGFRFVELPINPTGMNLIQESKTLKFLYTLYKRENPNIVHHVGLKNILWGGLAAKWTHIKGVVNAVSGLGGLFNGDGVSPLNRGILWLMGYSNNRDGVRVIFQNKDDMSIFSSYYVVRPEQIEFTKGSGIDLDEYKYVPEQEDEKINIIFTARMVREKGVCDLIEAAESIKYKYSKRVKFLLCGRLTPNKSGITNEYMQEHCDGEYICWLGERSDVRELLETSHIMAFPSYYREGVPKSLIEASAVGRPIITCNSIGCRDAVEDGLTGFLIEPRNPRQLADRLSELIEDRSLRIRMGREARKKAEREFSIEKVVDVHMNIYSELSQI